MLRDHADQPADHRPRAWDAPGAGARNSSSEMPSTADTSASDTIGSDARAEQRVEAAHDVRAEGDAQREQRAVGAQRLLDERPHQRAIGRVRSSRNAPSASSIAAERIAGARDRGRERLGERARDEREDRVDDGVLVVELLVERTPRHARRDQHVLDARRRRHAVPGNRADRRGDDAALARGRGPLVVPIASSSRARSGVTPSLDTARPCRAACAGGPPRARRAGQPRVIMRT